MSVTSGFFNSLNHDRRYNAQQMSAIFDGIINDGVFANIGVAFAINADTGVTITIGKGKAWFNSAWVYNDALLPKTLEGSEVVLDRIDAVVIEVDHNEAVRMGDIKIVKGTPSSSPQRPTMVDTEKKSQHPLAYIYRKAGSTEITQADITNMVGTSSCPYITGILQVQNIDNIVAQWEGQWNQWYAEMIKETDSDASELLAEMKSDFEIWFADIQALLDDDAATALAAQVAELQGKFDDLARDSCVYDTVEDSDLDVILGSDGTPIKGKTVFGAGGSEVDLSGYAKKEDLKKVEETLETVNTSKLDRTEKFARNLLDNSDFTHPVNQRGANSYSGQGYGIDRWKSWNNENVTTVNSGSVSCTKQLWQDIEPHKIKPNTPYTFAACQTDGTILCLCGLSGEETKLHDGTKTRLVISFEDDSPAVWIAAGDYVWAALYEGEYTAETLPEYQPKGYGAELAECQRYGFPLGKECIVSGYVATNGTSLWIQIPIPVSMRVAPTFVSDGTLAVRSVSGTGTIGTYAVQSAYLFANSLTIVFTQSEKTFTAASPMALYFSGNPYLSADL